MAKQDYDQVKTAVDRLLNVTTVVKRKKKNQSEKKRELFVQIVNSIEDVIVRSRLVYSEMMVDFMVVV